MVGEVEEFQNEPFGCCGVSGGAHANTQSTLINTSNSIQIAPVRRNGTH